RRVRQLAVALLGEAHRERFDLGMVPAHQRHYRARVETAREESAEGHVAYHLQLHRAFELGEKARHGLHRLDLFFGTGFAIRWRPIAHFAPASQLPEGVARRRELANAAEERPWSGHIAVREG